MQRVALNTTTISYANSLIVKPRAGILYSITGYNSGPEQFIQVHDTEVVPADGSVPKLIFIVPAGGNFSLDLVPNGRNFTNGITICNSTTGPVKTIGGQDCWFDAQFQ